MTKSLASPSLPVPEPVATGARQLAQAWTLYAEALTAQEPEGAIGEQGWAAMDAVAGAVHELGQAGILDAAMAHSLTVFEDQGMLESWHDFRHTVAMYASQREADGRDAQTHEDLRVVTRLFAIPMAGATSDVIASANEDLADLLLQSGALPKRSTVTILGVVAATKACELGVDPEWNWQAAKVAHQAQSESEAVATIMQHIPIAQAERAGGAVKIGGYVILGMHTSALGVDDDLPELGDAEEGRGQAWDEGLARVLAQQGRMIAGYPDVVLDAGVQAFAWQLHATFLMCRAAETNQELDESKNPIVRMGFQPVDGREYWPIRAHFSDGAVIELDLFPASGAELLVPVIQSLEETLGVEAGVVIDQPQAPAPTRRVLH